MIDFGALPPEINSARMYFGPGSGSLHAAATAWNGLAAELQSAASSYGSAISELTDDAWVGPSSTAMEAAATPYLAWMSATAGQAEEAAAQARAAASAYQSALTAMVPLATIAANRTQLASLTATNILGQNTPAIAVNEAQYGEMWAQDATTMYSYAGTSASASTLTKFTAPPSTTNAAGAASQAAAVTQASGTATGNGVQSALSQLSSAITSSLQNLASPAASSTTSTSWLTTLLNDLNLTSTSSTTGLPGLGSTGSSILNTILTLPIQDVSFFGLFASLDAIGPLISTPMNVGITQGMTAVPAAFIPPLAAGGAAAAAGVGAAGGLGGFAGMGGLAGLGQAASVGVLSVPQSWGWAATPAAAMMGGVPLASALPGASLGAASGLPMAAGLPFMMGGMPKAAGVAAAAGVGGAVASKYMRPPRVVARSPAAGYAPEDEEYTKPATAYPVPAGFPTNGHAPPGYTPAIVYLPTNGHAPPRN